MTSEGAYDRRLFKSMARKAAASKKTKRTLVTYVESLNEARTQFGEGRVLARWGWAGEIRDFFNSLEGRAA